MPISYLYVEDNADLREGICALIAHAEREITAVASAEEALALGAARHFDVLLSDVSLPGLSGIDLTRRWLAANPERQVVLLSGYDLSEQAGRLGRHVRALLKSCEPEELEALLQDVERSLRSSS